MHDGCSGKFESGQETLNKVRMMGYSKVHIPFPLTIECECGNTFKMETFEDKCDGCQTTYAVTPCHSFSAEHVVAVRN